MRVVVGRNPSHGAVGFTSHQMSASTEFINTSVAAEDVIRALEIVMQKAAKGVVCRPAREVHAENPDLFELSYALLTTLKAACKAKMDLLRALNMPPDTQFSNITR